MLIQLSLIFILINFEIFLAFFRKDVTVAKTLSVKCSPKENCRGNGAKRHTTWDKLSRWHSSDRPKLETNLKLRISKVYVKDWKSSGLPLMETILEKTTDFWAINDPFNVGSIEILQQFCCKITLPSPSNFSFFQTNSTHCRGQLFYRLLSQKLLLLVRLVVPPEHLSHADCYISEDN